MKIHAKEIADGLVDRLEANRSASSLCPISVQVNPSKEWARGFNQVLSASANPNQPDLHYLETVLVSTGFNKNDEYFSLSEVWEARKSPEDKPFNYEHDQGDIIGHLTSSRAVDCSTGKDISEETAPKDLPSPYDLVTGAVLYKYWAKEEHQKRMDTLIAEIHDGDKWFVSMECLFDDFDYALVDLTKSTAGTEAPVEVIQRNEETSFLTKHLRAYGGEGTFKQYKVGRLVKNIIFSGKGLVRKPANPASVILSVASKEKEIQKIPQILTEPGVTPGISPNTASGKDMTIMATTETPKDTPESPAYKAKAEGLEKSLEEAKSSLSMLASEKARALEEIESLKASLQTVQTEKATLEAERNTLLGEKKAQARLKAAMASLEIPEDQAIPFVNAGATLSDEAYEVYLGATKAVAAAVKAPPKATSLPGPGQTGDKLVKVVPIPAGPTPGGATVVTTTTAATVIPEKEPVTVSPNASGNSEEERFAAVAKDIFAYLDRDEFETDDDE